MSGEWAAARARSSRQRVRGQARGVAAGRVGSEWLSEGMARRRRGQASESDLQTGPLNGVNSRGTRPDQRLPTHAREGLAGAEGEVNKWTEMLENAAATPDAFQATV